MSSSCASLKSVVTFGWASADPSRTGCGDVASVPSGRTRRLSFSIPRFSALSEAAESGLEPVETPVTLVVDILFPAGREAGIL